MNSGSALFAVSTSCANRNLIGVDIASISSNFSMCQFYANVYTCSPSHTIYALGRYCHAANLIQTPCSNRTIWQKVYVGEDCEACSMPSWRVPPVKHEDESGENSKNKSSNGESSGKSSGKNSEKSADSKKDRGRTTSGHFLVKGRRGRKRY